MSAPTTPKKITRSNHSNSAELLLGDDSTLETANGVRFKEAKALEESGQVDEALVKYYQCVVELGGLSGENSSPSRDSPFLLCAVLKRIADIYYNKGDYEEGLKFLQAEKFIYEKALIGLEQSLPQSPLKNKQNSFSDLNASGGSGKGLDSSTGSTSSVGKTGNAVEDKANYLDGLAQVMLDAGKYDLALDYASKAVKIRRQLYGYDHELTSASLEKFGAAFASTGRDSYKHALEKRSTTEADPEDGDKGGDTPDRSRDPTQADGMDLGSALAGMSSYEASLERYRRKRSVSGSPEKKSPVKLDEGNESSPVESKPKNAPRQRRGKKQAEEGKGGSGKGKQAQPATDKKGLSSKSTSGLSLTTDEKVRRDRELAESQRTFYLVAAAAVVAIGVIVYMIRREFMPREG